VRALAEEVEFRYHVAYVPTPLPPRPMERYVPRAQGAYTRRTDRDVDHAPHGETISLMGGPRSRVPLVWEEALFEDPDDLVEVLGLSPALAVDLVDWAIAWQTEAGQPPHDAWARRLIGRLEDEAGDRYRFDHHR